MPPPLATLTALARLDGSSLEEPIEMEGTRAERRYHLYDLLRREQALASSEPPKRSEAARILDFAQSAYGDLVGLLCGRDDHELESIRDGEWALRDILRHAIAVELRVFRAGRVLGHPQRRRSSRDPAGTPPLRSTLAA